MNALVTYMYCRWQNLFLKITYFSSWSWKWVIHSFVFIQANIKHIHLNKKHHKNITLSTVNKINKFKNSAWLLWICRKESFKIDSQQYIPSISTNQTTLSSIQRTQRETTTYGDVKSGLRRAQNVAGLNRLMCVSFYLNEKV